MLHVVLDRQKKSKTILEKAFILYFAAFLSFCFLCKKNWKTGLLRSKIFALKYVCTVWYKKIKNFMLISKKQTCLSDKMLPRKVKI